MVDSKKSDKQISYERRLYEFANTCGSCDFESSIRDFFATTRCDYDCYVDTTNNK